MSKDKHTPGPWHYGGHTNIYAYYQRELLHSRVVACVPAAEVDGGKKERQANARLIAAAPELLEVLKAFPGFIDDATIGDDWIERAWAAIAKAEGRA